MSKVLKKLEIFSDIRYYDKKHVYILNGKRQKSVTSLLNQFKQKFNSDFWAGKKAEERGITKQEMLQEWKLKAKIATTKGTIVHSYIENLLCQKVYPFPYEYAESEVGKDNVDIVKQRFDIISKQVDKFTEDIIGKLLPVRSEIVVGDKNSGVCGMVDQLFFNYKANELQIWDWKTNKNIAKHSVYDKKLLGILSHLDECELTIYSLQLSMYKKIIQDNTGLDIGKCYLVWFFEGNSNYEVIECLDLTLEAELIFNNILNLN